MASVERGVDDRDERAAGPNLAATLEAHRRGDPEAINALLGACQSRIERLARHLLHFHPEIRRGFGDTLDIVQEASIRLWSALREMKPESERHLLATAAMKVRHQVIDLARKYRGPRSPIAGEVDNVVVVDGRERRLEEEAEDPVGDQHSLDEWTRFHAAVERLPAELKEPFMMRLYLGATVQRIAEVLGWKLKTVQRRLDKAKKAVMRPRQSR